MEADKKYLGHNIFLNEAIIPKTVLLARTYTINIIARHIGGIKSIMQGGGGILEVDLKGSNKFPKDHIIMMYSRACSALC